MTRRISNDDVVGFTPFAYAELGTNNKNELSIHSSFVGLAYRLTYDDGRKNLEDIASAQRQLRSMPPHFNTPLLQPPLIADAPLIIEGRRVVLYAPDGRPLIDASKWTHERIVAWLVLHGAAEGIIDYIDEKYSWDGLSVVSSVRLFIIWVYVCKDLKSRFPTTTDGVIETVEELRSDFWLFTEYLHQHHQAAARGRYSHAIERPSSIGQLAAADIPS